MLRLVDMIRLALAFVVLCGCGGGSGSANHEPDASGGGRPRGDGGSRGPGSDGGNDSDAADVACSGTLTGGLSGVLSTCDTPYVFNTSTAFGVQDLDGEPLEVGEASFSFQLLATPDTSTTYTFDNIDGGVVNLYENHATGPMTIWGCGARGDIRIGSGFALQFSSVDYVTTSEGTAEYKVHGHVACHFEAPDGSPPIDLALAF